MAGHYRIVELKIVGDSKELFDGTEQTSHQAMPCIWNILAPLGRQSNARRMRIANSCNNSTLCGFFGDLEEVKSGPAHHRRAVSLTTPLKGGKGILQFEGTHKPSGASGRHRRHIRNTRKTTTGVHECIRVTDAPAVYAVRPI
jgi:hypothetical protein